MNRGIITSGKLAEITKSRIYGNPDLYIYGASADSRKCEKGNLFVAVEGERTDGNLYASEAIANGAAAVLVKKEINIPPADGSFSVIVSEDPLKALQTAAGYIRRELFSLKVAGITGSNGKTTTKEILASILKIWKPGKILANKGNLNSDIGLPLTMFSLERNHEAAVLEMGMNRRGEIGLLASIAKPDIAVITNIGSAHAGMLGSVDAVAEEKRSILSYSDSNSIALIKYSEPYLDFLLRDFRGTVRLFGEWGKNGWEKYTDLGTGGFVINRKGRKINFRIPGIHNLYNAMAASEAALALGADEDSVVKGLESSVPVSGRTEIKNGEIIVIRDYYNANPESLLAALSFYDQLEVDGRKLFVMGDLLELGDIKLPALQEIGEKLAEGSVNTVFLFGENLTPVKEASEKQAVHPDFFVFRNIDEVKTALKDYLKKGDAVLLKGSRGSALERLDNVLEQIGTG